MKKEESQKKSTGYAQFHRVQLDVDAPEGLESFMKRKEPFTEFVSKFDHEQIKKLNELMEKTFQLELDVGREYPIIGGLLEGELFFCFVLPVGINRMGNTLRIEYMYTVMFKLKRKQAWAIILKYDDMRNLTEMSYAELNLEDIKGENYDEEVWKKRAEYTPINFNFD